MRTMTILALLGLICCLLGAGQGHRSPGSEKYVPSKIEWAELYFTANYREDNWDNPNSPFFAVHYVAVNDSTLLCRILVRPGTNSEIVTVKKEETRKTFIQITRSRGWDWLDLEIKTDVIRVKK